MYGSLGWRKDINNFSRDPFREVPVSAHDGTQQDFLDRMDLAITNAVAKGDKGITDIGPSLFTLAADARNLESAWTHLERYCGTAPGPNGLTYADFTKAEKWECIRQLHHSILEGTYHPGSERIVKIPKLSGKGERPLVLQNIEDRVVGRAIKHLLEPIMESKFEEFSYGSRRGKDRRHALAEALHHLEEDGEAWWIVADMRNAFEAVPIKRLMDVIAKHLPGCDDFLALIRSVLKRERKRGIRQGNPLSPLLLNTFLDHFLDKRWLGSGSNLIRVVDDLLICCSSREEAIKAYHDLEKLLKPTGMKLKGELETSIHHVKESVVEWLGFHICPGVESPVDVRISEKAWWKLEIALKEAYEKPFPPLLADSILKGWIEQIGPSFNSENQEEVFEKTISTASKYAFSETLEYADFLVLWQKAFLMWVGIKSTTRSRLLKGSLLQAAS